MAKCKGYDTILRVFICSGCGEVMYWTGNVPKADATKIATENARKKGWWVGDRCLCPECRERRKNR